MLLFFWLQDVNLAIERVKTRVREGVHNIKTDVIKRRYENGITNLFNIYLPIVDQYPPHQKHISCINMLLVGRIQIA
jgi:predicted ABC-type ATPase